MGLFSKNQSFFGLFVFILLYFTQRQKPPQQSARAGSLILLVTGIHLGYPTNILSGSCMYNIPFKNYICQEKLVDLLHE